VKWLNSAMGYGDYQCCDVFGIGAAGGAAIQGGAQLAAAGIQAHAVNKATEAQQHAAEQQMGFQRDVFNTQQQNLAPYLGLGQQAISSLSGQLQGGQLNNNAGQYAGQIQDFNPDSIVRNPDFAAPNTQTAQFNPNVNMQQDPGYNFRMNQGLEALQRSHAASGVSGGAAAKAILDYSQGLASQEYGQAYSRALQASQQNLGINQANFGQAAQTYGLDSGNHQQWIQNAMAANQGANQNVLNRFNLSQTGQTTQFNQQAALAGLGQTGNSQLQSAGNAAAQGMGQAYAGLGNANSAGSAAQGNIWGNLATGLGNTAQQYQMMRSMGMGGGGGGAQPYADQTVYPWSSLTG